MTLPRSAYGDASDTSEELVLAAIGITPMHNRGIAAMTGVSVLTVSSIIGRLLQRRRIECIGTAADACMHDVHGQTRIYAVRGTPHLPKIPLLVKKQARQQRQRLRGVGLTARIRADLLANGPSTCRAISQRLKAQTNDVAMYLRQMETRTKEIIARGSPKVYDVLNLRTTRTKHRPTEGSGHLAGPITIGRSMMMWPSNRSRAQ